MALVTPIRNLLIANRGEIARRIMRTAHEMGIHTVAVYAEGDVDAPFVKEADEAIALCGCSASDTYLNISKLIGACQQAGADAVHPGYGFLSETRSFAESVTDAGLKWVGPNPEVIGLMGDKLSAKQIMQDAGVPTLPAIELTEGVDVAEAAQSIGYPILIKASAGGGGRGMRVVEDEAALALAVDSAKREAASSFSDDTVFVEKWLDTARHIEIQILGDTHGNLVHCFERECSIQRRHQKVIEEAPSAALTESLRAKMGEAAVSAARRLGYSSAGTVEFLVSGEEFWFLEVNARLQVEHTVTEEVIGVDLVREQIRIAEGEKLSFDQGDIYLDGHAIEARLYAEDPETDFLPSPGPIVVWEPSLSVTARFDSGVEAGDVIGTEFDPMIAKVIVHAPTRREAALKLARTLETTRIHGLKTNRDFLVNTLRRPEFLAAETTTDFIERVNPAPSRLLDRPEMIDAAVAVVIEGQARNRSEAKVLRSIPSGWRNSTMPMEAIEFEIGSCEIHLEYRRQHDGFFHFAVDEKELSVAVHDCGDGIVDIELNGRRMKFRVDRSDLTWFVHTPRGGVDITEKPRLPQQDTKEVSGGLIAPMPAAVRKVIVKVGDVVCRRDQLLVLEAMKMEHSITAPMDGVVAAVHVQAGDQVKNGEMLITLDERE